MPQAQVPTPIPGVGSLSVAMINVHGAATAVKSLSTPVSTGPEQEPLSPQPTSPGVVDPVLCNHCGRTATNGLVCVGICVADSGY